MRLKTINAALKRAWGDYSKIVRLEEADIHGMCTCVTCGNRHRWDKGMMHAGHFYPARNLRSATKFLRDNIHPQCRDDNMLGRRVTTTFTMSRVIDVSDNYRQWMLDRYGQELLCELRSYDSKSMGWTLEDAIMFRQQCKERLEEIQHARQHATSWDPEEMVGVYTPDPFERLAA